MDSRELQALELAAKAKITWNGVFWLVPSFHRGQYKVNGDVTHCTCEDFELTDRPCKHMLAVKHVKARNRGTPITLPETREEVDAIRPKRKTYKQVWPAYNAAQAGEKNSFQKLLADLLKTIDEPAPRGGRGRPPIGLRTGLFAAVFKVYSTFSGRRFTCDLEDAVAKGHIDKAPHYNSVFRVLEDEATTPILRQLIVASSLPLTAIETTFAFDSSGFSTNKFGRWFDTKWGVEKRESHWIKVHLCVGTKTNIVTAVELGMEHDSQHLPTLLRTTAENFHIGDVTADKAYLSSDVLELIEGVGGSAYIPFKKNNRPNKNEVWTRLYHYFHLHRDEFLAHYHQRSNVESAFSMIKRKFSDYIRSKTEPAMTNESLAKVLCHNLCVLNQESHELGIDLTFGEKAIAEAGVEPEDDAPRVLRFPGA